MDPRDAPDQVLLGAMDYHYCVLVGLALWLEYHFMKKPENNEFIFSICGLMDEERIKHKASYLLKQILTNEDVERIMADVTDNKKIGTHSVRKYSTTTSRRILMIYSKIILCPCISFICIGIDTHNDIASIVIIIS